VNGARSPPLARLSSANRAQAGDGLFDKSGHQLTSVSGSHHGAEPAPRDSSASAGRGVCGCVFAAYDGRSALELVTQLPDLIC
jgi:hypothetical protein